MAGTAIPPGCLAPRGSMVRPSFGSCPQQMIGSTSRMQGKEASEQETKVQSNVGIDISKCWLDARVLPGNDRLHVANNCAGIRRLKRWLSHYRIALVAIEATGKWHRHLHRSLVALHVDEAESAQAERCVGAGGHRPRRGWPGPLFPLGVWHRGGARSVRPRLLSSTDDREHVPHARQGSVRTRDQGS